MAELFLVAQDEDLAFLFRRIFAHHTVRAAPDAERAIGALREKPADIVVLDIHGSPDDLSALRKIRDEFPDQLVIVLTSYGTAQTAVEAIKQGAYDYLFKPFDIAQLRQLVAEALDVVGQKSRAPSEVAPPEERLPAGMIGTSPGMQEVYRKIGKAAPTDLTVLIQGESGTGKELVARLLHEHSRRAAKPFLALNCAAIPEPLLESELFGYERGAFTGAHHRKIGKLEVCSGGTLFLDEIGDMSPALQTKMLRVLQEGTFERIGGTETIKVDVRVIAATNRDLVELMRQGRFRDDLYYRLKVVPIQLPPLRERGDDIVLLAKHFLRRTKIELNRPDLEFSAAALNAMRSYHWPGNVRELENVVRSAALTCPGSVILPEHLAISPGALEVAPPGGETARPHEGGDDLGDLLDPVFRILQREYAAGRPVKVFDQVEEILIRKALDAAGGNQSQAARILGITRTTLRKRMQRYGIAVHWRVE